uniref:Uncharacterized protein n=1 Tax=viral metagenome TaxID=1070528 RepID=A0A6M3JXK9_9ZZZZ
MPPIGRCPACEKQTVMAIGGIHYGYLLFCLNEKCGWEFAHNWEKHGNAPYRAVFEVSE